MEIQFNFNLPSPIQEIFEPIFEEKKIKVFVKRDDLIHDKISGNKWRKLKYNLLKIKELGVEKVVSFGGAFSNHIYSLAAAGKYFGIETIGIIRGDELNENSSKTLKFAHESGMKLIFVSRSDFRVLREMKNEEEVLAFFSSKTSDKCSLYRIEVELKNKISFQNSYLIPEGGTNDLALRGGSELVDEIIEQLGFVPDAICTAVGTGGTLAGICSNYHEKLLPIGIAVLKDANYIFENIRKLLKSNNFETFHWDGFLEYHHGGYAKTSKELIDFIQNFEKKHQILLEQVYTGKLLYAIYRLIEENWFPENSRIVLLHTGGLQGRSKELGVLSQEL